MTDAISPAGGRCPICGKPVHLKFRPFCSARCADVDLGRWFNEGYRVPSEELLPHAGSIGDDDED